MYKCTLSLTSALDGVLVHSHAWSVYSLEISGTHSVEGKGGPRGGLDGTRNLTHLRNSIPGPSSP
jgi:hypothetical protein